MALFIITRLLPKVVIPAKFCLSSQAWLNSRSANLILDDSEQPVPFRCERWVLFAFIHWSPGIEAKQDRLEGRESQFTGEEGDELEIGFRAEYVRKCLSLVNPWFCQPTRDRLTIMSFIFKLAPKGRTCYQTTVVSVDVLSSSTI
jgi:hypothetical protein